MTTSAKEINSSKSTSVEPIWMAGHENQECIAAFPVSPVIVLQVFMAGDDSVRFQELHLVQCR